MSTDAPWPAGLGREVHVRLDSTNAHALRRAPDLKGPAWFLAGEQTAGRGRRARPWVSPPGNFHATLLLHPAEPPATAALRSFAAALAVRQALAQFCGTEAGLSLKWPNDVLLGGEKVAGILLESVTSGAMVAHLAIGIGVNLIAHPGADVIEPGALPATSVLAATGLRVQPEAFLHALAHAYAGWEARFVTEGFAPLRAEWLAHAARLGETIRARTGAETREGVFETIDASGNLILRQPGGAVAIPAAEVFF